MEQSNSETKRYNIERGEQANDERIPNEKKNSNARGNKGGSRYGSYSEKHKAELKATRDDLSNR